MFGELAFMQYMYMYALLMRVCSLFLDCPRYDYLQIYTERIALSDD